MPRDSFSRTVARAAASGGSRAYRGKSPRAWYVLITAICVLGVSLIAYSRNERLHPYHAPAVQPTSSAHWYAALGIDLCGKVQPDLPANPNFTTVGIRTAGDGVILVAPGAATTPSDFTGKHDTLGTFFGNYPGSSLTATSIQLPAKAALKNGDRCTAALGPVHGTGKLVVETWSSASAEHGTIYSGNPTGLKLLNGMMVTVGFVPPHTTLPVPPSKKALVGDLNGTAVSAPPTAPTIATTTTVPGTTSPGSSSTLAGSKAGTSSTLAGSKAGTSSTLAGSKAGTSSTVASKAAAGSQAAVSPGSGSGRRPTTTIGAAGVAAH